MLVNVINPANILVDEEMKKHTSFKIGGKADFLVKVDNIEQIRSILKLTKENKIPLTIIGNGSNLLVKDNGIRGITLKVNINNIEIQTSQKMEETYKIIDKVKKKKITYSNQAI